MLSKAMEDAMYGPVESSFRREQRNALHKELLRALRPDLEKVLERLADPEICGLQLCGLDSEASRMLSGMIHPNLAKQGRPVFDVSLYRMRDAENLAAAVVDRVEKSSHGSLIAQTRRTKRSFWSMKPTPLSESVEILKKATAPLNRPVLLLDELEEARDPERMKSAIAELSAILDGWKFIIMARRPIPVNILRGFDVITWTTPAGEDIPQLVTQAPERPQLTLKDPKSTKGAEHDQLPTLSSIPLGRVAASTIAPEKTTVAGRRETETTPDLSLETKVILIGEGTVGKTSLVWALRGEEFRDHKLTHGIEIHPVAVTDPERGRPQTLRLWDFGGQAVYQPTHQFFYSQHALYLVVWNARAGQDKDDVAGWIRRIFQQVGDTARVMVVATHSDEADPDLHYAALQREYPDMMAGCYAVDNKSGRGIPELRAALAREAATQRTARARQVQQIRAQSWMAARDQVLSRAEAEPCISFGEFAAACRQHGMTDDDVVSLANQLNDQGLITYLGDDEVLSELVVLNPEWLSKAIGHVMEDEEGTIRAARGVLDHQQLGQIWRDRPGEPAYSRRMYPYFLRVMEKFETAFRLEDGAHSLIAQLVPVERPDSIPWRRETPLPTGVHRLVLLCTLSGAIPGFMARLTVRLGYADAGLRWRRGVFLRHPVPAYASEALIEMATDTSVRIEVRAPSPDFFLHVLRDSVEHLAASSPGLTYRMFTPCPDEPATGCDGVFPLTFLLDQPPATEVPCQACGHRYQVAELLTGLRHPGDPAAGSSDAALCEALDRVVAPLRRDIGDLKQDVHAAAADHADAMRRLFTVASAEVPDCPHLFTLVEAPGKGISKLDPRLRHYRLTLWCEQPGHWHPYTPGSYTVERTTEWFREVAHYVQPMLQILREVFPVAGPVAKLVFTKTQAQQIGTELDLAQALLSDLPQLPNDDPGWGITPDGQAGPIMATGASLRGVRHLLNDNLDPSRQYGGLTRRLTAEGNYIWICPDHAAAGNPDSLQQHGQAQRPTTA